MIEDALRLCSDAGISFDRQSVVDQLEQYTGLIREWNAYASLLSAGDAELNLGNHCVDSLSLAPCLQSFMDQTGGRYVDIGSGGGFPAIPLSILFPGLEMVLIERNTKKSVFLKKVVRALSLVDVKVVNESFGAGAEIQSPKLITTRAIEKPVGVIEEVLSILVKGDLYLCQSEAVHEVAPGILSGFTVDEIMDGFSVAGMRRNRLYKIGL